MAPMFPWTDCHKLIMANRNPWQNRILTVLSFPRLSNIEKPELKNMNANVSEYVYSTDEFSQRITSALALCMRLYTHAPRGTKSLFSFCNI